MLRFDFTGGSSLHCTVDGQKVPYVHRRLICQKVSVSCNLSQKVLPSDEDFSCLHPTFSSKVITFRAGFFLCGFPVGASGRNHRTIEFFSNFLEFFGKMLEFFEQKYQVFGKNFEF